MNFFEKNLEFQDYLLIAKKNKLYNIKKHSPNGRRITKIILYRFISFIDAFYENKVVLSLSSNVQLNKIYLGKTNAFEFKRTLSRLEEMGSDSYINKNIKRKKKNK